VGKDEHQFDTGDTNRWGHINPIWLPDY